MLLFYIIVRSMDWLIYLRGVGLLGMLTASVWGPLMVINWQRRSNGLLFSWNLMDTEELPQQNPFCDPAKAEKYRALFFGVEDVRDAYSPIRVLHTAVTLSGIAGELWPGLRILLLPIGLHRASMAVSRASTDMGPILPLLSNIEADKWPEIEVASKALLEANGLAISGQATAKI